MNSELQVLEVEEGDEDILAAALLKEAGIDPKAEITSWTMEDYAVCVADLVIDEQVTKEEAVELLKRTNESTLADLLQDLSQWAEAFRDHAMFDVQRHKDELAERDDVAAHD